MYESKRQYQYGTGRRKSSVARVRVYQGGTGSITINGRDIDDYFGLETLKLVTRQPLVLTDTIGKMANGWLKSARARYASGPVRHAPMGDPDPATPRHRDW